MSQFLPEGFILKGAYQILARLGQGGFAVTYRALDIVQNKEVCIKESFVAQFQVRAEDQSVQLQDQRYEQDVAEINRNVVAEAKALSELNHKGVVGVQGFFEENNTIYIVLDYIKGETLKQLVERLKNGGSQLGGNQLRHIFLHLAEAMAFVHENGMLHQDISPDNVMIRQEDLDPVLIDFGSVARLEIEASTQSRLAFFKDGYSPPELYRREDRPTKASDVYSLAATMVFAITGSKPPDAIVRAKKQEPITGLLDSWVVHTRWDVPLENAMKLDPERRIKDLRPMINAFLRPIVPPPPTPPPPPAWKKVIAAALVMLPFVACCLGWYWRHQQSETHRKTAEHLLMTIPEFPFSLVADELSSWPTSAGVYSRSAAQQDKSMWEDCSHLSMTRFAPDTAGWFSYTRMAAVDEYTDTVKIGGWLQFDLFSGKVVGWKEGNHYVDRLQNP